MSIKDNVRCEGCGVCLSICPTGAITFKTNEHGFSYPAVDSAKCVECHLCEKYCNADKLKIEKQHIMICYGAKCKDEKLRKESSSGGAFSPMAQYILGIGGVVYGCKLNDKFIAVHDRATTWDECQKFMGSKYVQSNLEGVYSKIEDDLKQGRPVLFTGVSCQCAAVRNFAVQKKLNHDNLFLCELLCHGAASPMVYEDFKCHMEEKYQGKIVDFRFRDKEKVSNPPSSRGIRIFIKKSDNIEDIYDEFENDTNYNLFKRNYTLRKSCYDCQFIGYERCADITIADYWGCERWHPEFFDRRGVSLILVNTELGRKLFDDIRDKFDYIEVKESEIVQKPLIQAAHKEEDYDSFWDTYIEKGYVYTADKFVGYYVKEEERIRKNPVAKAKRYIKKIMGRA